MQNNAGRRRSIGTSLTRKFSRRSCLESATIAVMAHWGPEHHGEITTLQHAARANRMVWCFCTNCGRAELAHPYRLAEKLGRNAALADLPPHLKCTGCMMRGYGVVLVSQQLYRDRRPG